MNLLDYVEVPEKPTPSSLTKLANKLIGNRPTRRKKSKPKHVQKKKQGRNKALKQYKKQSQQRWEQYQEYRRLIAKD